VAHCGSRPSFDLNTWAAGFAAAGIPSLERTRRLLPSIASLTPSPDRRHRAEHAYHRRHYLIGTHPGRTGSVLRPRFQRLPKVVRWRGRALAATASSTAYPAAAHRAELATHAGIAVSGRCDQTLRRPARSSVRTSPRGPAGGRLPGHFIHATTKPAPQDQTSSIAL
jgi:hypothetical protein